MKGKLVHFLAIYISLIPPAFGDIKILNPWVRAAGSNAALFMAIDNTKNKPDKLIGVETIASSHIDLHNHVDMGNGILHMEKVDSIDIPADGYMMLKPGGHHIMLRELHGPLQQGGVVRFTLKFESGKTVQGIAPIKNTEPGS